MSLHLLLSTSTQRLIDDLVASLARPGSGDALRPVLLPSRPLVERVRVAMARRTGVAMGVQFLLPAKFLDQLGKKLGLDELNPSWTPEGMFWRIYGLLEEHKDSARLAAACADERARVSLARQVADRFDQYLHFRPELIAAWDKGEAWGRLPDSVKEDERWQRQLWEGLKAQLVGHPHPAERLELLLAKAREAKPGLFAPAVEVLATGPLPAAQLRVLAALGSSAEVRLRVLMPSEAYFGDIQSAKAQRYLDLDADPDLEGHPLLAQMGSQARAHLRALVDLDESGQAIENIEPEWDEPRTLLGRLQHDIRASQQPKHEAHPALDADRSLRVHRCHGPRREVEVLRDELLRAFEELPGLRAEEVLILAPDLGVYGPLAESLLGGTGLPLRLAERKGAQGDPLQQAARALLAMAAGRCALSEGLDLLELPAVRLVLGEDEAQALAQRLQVSGITFGLDGAHRRRLRAGEEETGTWRAGLDRLLAGLWLGQEPGSVDAAGSPALPVSGDLGGSGSAAAFAWLEALLELLQQWQQPAAPAVWAERLDSALQALFLERGQDQELDTAGLDETLASLRQAQREHGAELPLQAASLVDWMDEYALEEARLVAPVGGAMALGGLKPLRALPCRVLAVLGLKDSAFPRRSQAPAWDLMAAKKQAGDRDPREEDRQLFLDALLAAKDRVILTAPAISPQTNKEEPLSACLEELLREAGRAAQPEPALQAPARQALVLKHPLQPFNPASFGAVAHSFDAFNAALAQALAPGRSRHAHSFAEGALVAAPPTAGMAADLDALQRFLRDPAAAWLRGLKVSPPREAEGAGDDDAEPLDLDGLERWQLADAALQSLLRGDEPFLDARLAADRLLPYGRLGQASGAAVLSHLNALAQRLRAKVGPWDPRLLNAGSDGWTLSGSALLGADGRHQVFYSASALDKPRVMLEAWVQACFAAAAAEARPLWVAGYHKKEGAQLKRLERLEAKAARVHLGALLELWRQGQGTLLPFAPKTSHALAAAILKAEAKGERGAEVDAVAQCKALGAWHDAFESKGEGGKPSFRLAWRGLEPLEGEDYARWKATALQVWTPLLAWWDAESGESA